MLLLFFFIRVEPFFNESLCIGTGWSSFVKMAGYLLTVSISLKTCFHAFQLLQQEKIHVMMLCEEYLVVQNINISEIFVIQQTKAENLFPMSTDQLYRMSTTFSFVYKPII